MPCRNGPRPRSRRKFPQPGTPTCQGVNQRRVGMRRNTTRNWLTLAVLLLLPLLVVLAQQTSSLTIDGQQGQAKVVQIQGKNYVEVDGLARLTGGSIRFAGSQIVLSLPGSNGATPAAALTQPPPGFSKEFLNTGIEAMAQVREWHAALRNAIERGYPLSAEWLPAVFPQPPQGVGLSGG